MSKKQKQAVVLGQRRSGTSLVAGVLYHLGIPMGEEATPEQTSDRNKHGFFEDKSFTDLSERITHYVNQYKQSGRAPTAAHIEYKFDEDIKKVVEARKNDGDIWGVKDVNQLQVHKFFKKYFDNPLYIAVMRNPVDCAYSKFDWYGKQNNKPYEHFLNEAIESDRLLLKLLQILEGEIMIFSYDRALRNPDVVVDRVVKFLGIKPTKEQIKNAVNHIKEPTDYAKK